MRRPHRLPLTSLALITAIFAAPAARAEGPLPLPELPTETIHLPNGLRVLLAPDPHAPFASLVASYAVGAADDPNGRRGLAHVVEHLLFQRLKHVDSPARALESAGASGFSGTTGPDSTRYFESFPPERLETILWLESDRMGFGAEAITPQGLAGAQLEIHNETRDRSVDGQLAGVARLVNRELFPDWHPYAARDADDDDLDRISVEDARAFIHTWYGPSNATLAIAGRFDRAKTMALIERYFGSLPAAPPPPRPALPRWVNPGVRLTAVAPGRADQVDLEWRTPAFGTKDDAALDLAVGALTGAGNERFTRALIATNLATSVSARQRSERRDSVFYVAATVAPGVSPARVVDAIQATIDDFALTSGAGEIARARGLWRSGTLDRLETSSGRASQLVSLAEVGIEGGPGYDWGLNRYEALTEADVGKAVATWLGADRRVAVAVIANRAGPIRGALVKREEVTR